MNVTVDKLMLVFFLSFLMVACNGSKENETRVQDSVVVMTDSLQSVGASIYKDTQFYVPGAPVFIQLDSINTQPVTVLPIGSKLLLTYKFPESWLSYGETGFSEPTGMNKQYKDAMHRVHEYYDAFHHGKPYLLPVIHELKYVKLHEKEDTISAGDSLVYSIKYCNYRFPDVGMYECYYAYNSGRYVRTIDYQDLYHDAAGHLILYDRKTKNAKYITIYDQKHDEVWSGSRLFLINKDHSIQLFDVDFGEEETTFSKSYTININQNGEIVVE